MSIMIGDVNAKLYLGDTLLSRDEPKYVSSDLFWYTNRDIGPAGTQVRIGAGLDFSNGYTFEACTKITSVNQQYFRLLEFAPYGSSIDSATVIASMNYGVHDIAINGDWLHHNNDYEWPVNELFTASIVVDIPNAIAYLYVDGEVVDTFTNINTNTSGMASRGGQLYVGCGTISDRILPGSVYSGRFYDRILTSSEMATNRETDQMLFVGE